MVEQRDRHVEPRGERVPLDLAGGGPGHDAGPAPRQELSRRRPAEGVGRLPEVGHRAHVEGDVVAIAQPMGELDRVGDPEVA